MRRWFLILAGCLALQVHAGQTPVRIGFWGDSITDNNPWDLTTNEWFTAHQATGTNFGVSGAQLAELQTHFSTNQMSDLAGIGTNNYRWLMIGCNDLWYSTVTGDGSAWWTDLTNFCSLLRSNDCKLILSTILPMGWDHDGRQFNESLRLRINNKIRAATNLYDVLVDTDKVMPRGTTPGLYGDRAHPSDAGNGVIVSNLAATLQRYYPLVAWTTNYVDASVVGGANNGTSWANAWRSFTNLDYNLSLVSPNTIVEISGGDYLPTNELTNLGEYDGFRLCQGTSVTNRIIYRASTEAGHNGTVTLKRGILLGPWTELNGSKTNDYEAGIGDNTYLVPLVTNNCNIVIDLRDIERRDLGWHNFLKFYDGGPITVKWVKGIGLEVPTTGSPVNETDMEWKTKNTWGSSVDLYAIAAVTAVCQLDLGYCWFSHFWQGFNTTGGPDAGFGTVRVHHTLLENHHVGIFDEGFGPGVDYDHNIFRKRIGDYRHSESDGFQCNGGSLHHVRVHHNIIEPPDNSLGDWVMSTNSYNLMFYDNVIKPQSWATIPIYDYQTRGSPLMMRGDSEGVTISNAYFFHNTLVCAPGDYATATELLQFQNDAYTKIVSTNGLRIYNNLFYQGGSGETVALGLSNWQYNASCVLYDWNMSYTTNATHNVLRWLTATNGTSIQLTNAVDIAAQLGFSNNVTETSMAFQNEAAADYRPTSAAVNIGTNLVVSLTVPADDTVARNMGLKDLADIEEDIYGNFRGKTNCSAGAVEYFAITDTSAPTLAEELQSVVAPFGTSPRFSVLANGAPPLSFYWKFNGTVISNSPWPFYFLFNASNANVGSYSVTVSNQYGTVNSVTASYSTNSLLDGCLLWLTFDETSRWTNGGYIPDHSGKTNHAYIFDPPEFSAAYAGHYSTDIAYTNEIDPANGWYYMDPLSASRGAHRNPIPTNGPNSLNAAQFLVVYRGTTTVDAVNAHAFGTFAGITNQSGGWLNLTNGTWTVWAKYHGAVWGGKPTQTAVLSSGYDTNNWSFREGPNETTPGFLVHTNGTESPFYKVAEFADVTVINDWKHYAVTWDGSNWISYSNAVPILTNVSTFAYITATNSMAGVDPDYNWIALGIQTHSGLPDQVMATDFPNNGAFIGQLADVRMYNRALSAGEISAVYAYGGGEVPPEPPASSTNSFRASGRITASGRVTMR